VKEKKIEVRFVKSEDNVADCLTKNLPLRDFEKHSKALKLNRLSAWREDVKCAGLGRSADVQTRDAGPDQSPT
jgi:hypothetical protein